jgi:hypothetical protein
VNVFFLVEQDNRDARRIKAPAEKMILWYEIRPGTVLRINTAAFFIK